MDISIFLWCFLLVAGAFSASVPEIFGGPNPINVAPPPLPNMTEIQEQYNPPETNSTDIWAVLSYYQAVIIASVQYVIASVNVIWRIAAPAVNLGGWLHDLFPWLPWELCAAITAITWIVYIAGIAQFISGRSAKMIT